MATLLMPRRSGAGESLRVFARLDWWLLLAAGTLLAFGLLSLHSIDVGTKSGFLKRQGFNFVAGMVPFLAFLLVPLASLRKYASFLYAFNLGLLGSVLVIGVKRGGDAQRWIEVGPINFQPSEFAKIALIVTLAAFWASRSPEERTTRHVFLLSFAHVAVPMALILAQPHLGATISVFMLWLTISLIMGAKARHVVLALGLGTLAFVAAVRIPLLPPYMLSRVYGLLTPTKDQSYQVERGIAAIASGGLLGKGYLRGDFVATKYVPEQETDFIVTVLGEEAGLVGCGLLVATYGILYGRLWLLAQRARDPLNRGIIAGVLVILAFHTVVNLGMVMQMLPVVGLWLPFLSYGGTALWLCMSCVAIAVNATAREREAKF